MNAIDQMKKYLTPAVWMKYVTLAAAVLLAVSLVMGLLPQKDDTSSALPFNPLQEEGGTYNYLDIVSVSDWLYEYDSAIYYSAFDADGYCYTVRLSDKQFQELAEQYTYFMDESSPMIPVRLYGTSAPISTDTANAITEVWQLDDVAEYYDYFGYQYLNATLTPAGNTQSLWLVIALFSFLIALLFAVLYYIPYNTSKKCLNRLTELGELEHAATQFISSDNEIIEKNDKMRLGTDFLYSKQSGVLRYDDIVWCYKRVNRRNFIAISSVLVAESKTIRELPLIQLSPAKKNDETFAHVMEVIASHNPEVLLGYSKENIAAAKLKRTK